MKIKNVIQGWTNTIVKDKEVEETAAMRLQICSECPMKGSIFNVDVCLDCGCPLKAKTRSNDTCPLGKW